MQPASTPFSMASAGMELNCFGVAGFGMEGESSGCVHLLSMRSPHETGKMERGETMMRRTADSSASSAYLFGGRLLMFLTLVLVVVMPLTEYFWHFDRFMQGGQDFELSLLAAMTFLCLILVLFQKGKRSVALLMALRRWLGFVFCAADPGAPGSMSGLITLLHATPLPSASLGLYNLPQQI